MRVQTSIKLTQASQADHHLPQALSGSRCGSC